MENLPNIFKDSMRKAELQAHNYMITDILSLLVEINDIVNQKNKIECNEQNQELTSSKCNCLKIMLTNMIERLFVL